MVEILIFPSYNKKEGNIRKMKKSIVRDVIIEYLQKNETIDTSQLLSLLNEKEHNIKLTSVRWYLYDFKRAGLIADISRGIYVLQKHNFKPDLAVDDIKKISKKMATSLPLLKYCVWSTKWIHDLMIHQPTTSILIVETEPGAENSVFSLLQEITKDPLIKPSAIEIERYVLGTNKIIIKSLVHDSPLIHELVPTPKIEKILVDLFIEKDLFLQFQGKELVNIFSNAFASYDINLTTLLAYAERRKKKKDLIEFIKIKIEDKFNDTYRVAFSRLA